MQFAFLSNITSIIGLKPKCYYMIHVIYFDWNSFISSIRLNTHSKFTLHFITLLYTSLPYLTLYFIILHFISCQSPWSRELFCSCSFNCMQFQSFCVEAVLRLMLGNLISYAITFSRLFDNTCIQKYAIFLGVFFWMLQR